MAKKRQRKKMYRPPNPRLQTSFNCPECGRKKVVEVKFNKRENVGYLRCRGCGIDFNTKLKKASTPIDVYYNWIDQRDEEKEKNYSESQKEKEVDEDNVINEENEIDEEEEREQEQENEDQYQEKEDDFDGDPDDDEADEDYDGSD